MKSIAILGSTGSIGSNALKVVQQFPERFKVKYLTAGTNYQLLAQQALEFQPDAVVIAEKEYYVPLKELLAGSEIKVHSGADMIQEICRDTSLDLVLNAIVGAAGLLPTIASVETGKIVALSNKESIVMAGELINRLKRQSGAQIHPVDSEHSAIWQCLQGEDLENIKRIILTGSGGPFRKRPLHTFSQITPEEALQHPNWNMGRKITIDSATMMNKGLEVIEARWLFNCPLNKIDVVIHPQSIIHSMVEFEDTSIKAQLGIPDMKVPIQYALTYPERLPMELPELSFVEVKELTFEEVDQWRYPCLSLAYEALEAGGTATTVVNEINELAVKAFLEGEIPFTAIAEMITTALEEIAFHQEITLDNIIETQIESRDWFRRNLRHYVP